MSDLMRRLLCLVGYLGVYAGIVYLATVVAHRARPR